MLIPAGVVVTSMSCVMCNPHLVSALSNIAHPLMLQSRRYGAAVCIPVLTLMLMLTRQYGLGGCSGTRPPPDHHPYKGR